MVRSRIIRLAAGGVAGVLGLLALLAIGVHTPPARRLVLEKTAALLHDQGIDFAASRLDYNLFLLRFELRDVRVRSRQAPDLPPVFTADRVAVDLGVRRLVSGVYQVEDAAIDNPRVQVVVDANGRDNLPHPPPKDKPSSPLAYEVRHLAIRGGTVSYEERRQQLAVSLPLDRITMDGEQIRLQARQGGTVAMAAQSLPVRSLTGDVMLGTDALQIRSLRADLGDSSLAVSGTVTHFDSPQLDLRSDATLALAALSGKLRGTLDVTLAASGPLAQVNATARVSGQGIQADRFDRLSVEASAAYSAAASRVRLESLTLTSPLGKIHGQGDVALNAGESTARVRLEGGNLERLSTLLKLPVRIASTAAATVEARWPALEFQQARGDAAIHLQASRPAPAENIIPVDAVLRATGNRNRLVATLENLRSFGAVASGELTLTGQSAIAGGLRVDAPRLSATATAAEAFLARPLGTPLEGTLRSTVTLAGTVSAPQAAITAAVPDLAIGELHDVTLQAAAAYSPGRVSIDQATVTWQNQALHLAGTIASGIHLTAAADRLSVAAILAGLTHGDVPAAGQLSLAAEVTGSIDSPAATITLTASQLAAYQESFGTLQARAQLQGRQLELTALSLDKPQPGGNGTLRASGAYDLDAKQYRFQAEAQDFRLLNLVLPDRTPVRAAIRFSASGHGAGSAPAGEGKLRVDGIRIGDRDYGSAVWNAQAANGQVTFEASAPQFNLTASGKLATDAPHPATLQVRLADSTFPPVDGAVSAVIDASGDLDHYRQGTARAEVTHLAVKLNGETVQTEGPLVAAYANDTLTVEKAALVAAGSRLEIAGSLPLATAAGQAALTVKGHLNLPGLAHLAPAGMGLQMQGALSLEGTLRGTLARIDPTLSIVLNNGAFSFAGLSPSITAAALRGQVRDGALELERASAKWGEASFEASGTVPFALLPADLPVEFPRRQGAARLQAELKNVNLAAIPGIKEGLGGVVSLRLEAEAPRPQLEAVQATLTFPDLQARIDTYAVAQQGISEIVLDNGVACVRRLQLTGPATQLQVSGTAQLTGQRPLDLRLDGTLDASLAAVFTSGLRARGATEIHAALTGPAATPQVKGYLQVADAQLSIQEPRIGIDGLNLRVDLEGARATLAKLEGQINGGTLSGHGSISYADGKLAGSDLTVQADDLYLDFPAGLKTVSDVHLQLKNVGTGLALRGAVVVKEGGFTDDLNFDKGILAAVTAPRPLLTAEARNPLLESLRFNVSVVTRDPIVVQNNLAKAELTAQLILLGNPYELGLAGRLIIEEGSELTLQERRYEVTQGVITFTNERRIEPTLDIAATTSVSGYDITLRVSGPPGDTKTELSSPPLTEPDILAILVTGKTLDEIRGQEMQVARNPVPLLPDRPRWLLPRPPGRKGHRVEPRAGGAQPDCRRDQPRRPPYRRTGCHPPAPRRLFHGPREQLRPDLHRRIRSVQALRHARRAPVRRQLPIRFPPRPAVRRPRSRAACRKTRIPPDRQPRHFGRYLLHQGAPASQTEGPPRRPVRFFQAAPRARSRYPDVHPREPPRIECAPAPGTEGRHRQPQPHRRSRACRGLCFRRRVGSGRRRKRRAPRVGRRRLRFAARRGRHWRPARVADRRRLSDSAGDSRNHRTGAPPQARRVRYPARAEVSQRGVGVRGRPRHRPQAPPRGHRTAETGPRGVHQAGPRNRTADPVLPRHRPPRCGRARSPL